MKVSARTAVVCSVFFAFFAMSVSGQTSRVRADTPPPSKITAADHDPIAATYEALSSLDASGRRDMYSLLEGSVKGELWKFQLRRFIAAHPEFVEAQRAVVFETISLIDDGLFGINISPEERAFKYGERTKDLAARARMAFGGDLLREGFLQLGTSFSPSISAQVLPAHPKAPNYDCECSTEDDWCGNWWSPTDPTHCVGRGQSGGCTLVDGCGWLYQYACNGNCV